MPRLQRLASFYSVPVDQLLPRDGNDGKVVDITDRSTAAAASQAVTIDLMRLRGLDSPGAELLVRYLQMIQVQRQDFNGRMLTVRRDDLRAIACILDTSLENTVSHLENLGLCLSA